MKTPVSVLNPLFVEPEGGEEVTAEYGRSLLGGRRGDHPEDAI